MDEKRKAREESEQQVPVKKKKRETSHSNTKEVDLEKLQSNLKKRATSDHAKGSKLSDFVESGSSSKKPKKKKAKD